MTHPPTIIHQKPLESRATMLESICSIRLGSRGIIYRWKPGSTIKFNIDCHSFPQGSYAHASTCLEAAARLWNNGNVGVQFERVADHEPSTFRLTYEHIPKDDDTAADAFLPNELQIRQPRLIVYPLAFSHTNGCYGNLTNLLCHELGHILGLRHEFQEPSDPSVRWGQKNRLSVMNYFNHPREAQIQDRDFSDIQLFYAYEGSRYKRFEIIDVDPVDFNPPSQ